MGKEIKLELRARREGYRTEVFQLMGEKWRVDYAPQGEEREKKAEESATVRVVEKIIFRGKKGRGTKELERKIGEISEKRGGSIAEDAMEGEYFGRERVEQWFDGTGREERIYREKILPAVMKNGGRIGDVLPQVGLGSLVSDRSVAEEDPRRVDFVVSNGEKSIVIEVDDATHEGHGAKDKERDRIIAKSRIKTVRVVGEDFTEAEHAIEELYKKCAQTPQEGAGEAKEPEGYTRRVEAEEGPSEALKRAGAFQGAIVRLMRAGYFEENAPEGRREARIGVRGGEAEIYRAALEELKELEGKVAEMYGEKSRLAGVEYGEGGLEIGGEVLAERIRFHREIENLRMGRRINKRAKVIKTETLEYLLKFVFGFSKFRKNQMEGIVRSLKGEDSIILLPTGSGKSVIFQLTALIVPNGVVVVEPLKSLMEDQVENLGKRGIDIVINASGEKRGYKKEEVYEAIEGGKFAMLYVTPERMMMEEFREVVARAKRKGVGFQMVALDEAHCVSEWGHDFRVAYLNIAGTSREIFRQGTRAPVVLALTGTASDNVLRDMERDLGIDETGVVRPESFDRPEIHYRVVATTSEEKMATLKWLLEEMVPKEFGEEDARGLMRLRGEETKAGIVFCVYKSGKTEFGVNRVFEELNREGYPGVVRYYSTVEEARTIRANAEEFKRNEAGLMVATKAFGMGIDKANIRYTIHFGIPSSIEAYYQEAGRAGRDGEKSVSYIILSNDAPERNGELIKDTSVEDLRKELRKIGKKKQDDVNRLLFLHQRNFDKRQTIIDTETILQFMGELKRKKMMLVAPSGLEFERWQKVFYRMKLLEIIEDYAIASYPNSEFSVRVNEFSVLRTVEAMKRYVGQYQEGQVGVVMERLRQQKYGSKRSFVVGMMNMLLDFINGMFESARRRAIGNMLQLAEEVAEAPMEEQDGLMRRKILGHLGNTYKDLLEEIERSQTGVEEAIRAIKGVRNGQEEQLVMEARRALQNYPEHPGLLMTVGLVGAIDRETNPIVAGEDIRTTVENATERYGIERGEVVGKIVEGIGVSAERARDKKKYRQFLEILYRELGEEFQRGAREVLPAEYVGEFYLEELVGEMGRVLAEVREVGLWTR